VFYNESEGGKIYFKETKGRKEVQFWGGRTLKFRLLKEELTRGNGQTERFFIRGCLRVKIFEILE